MPDLSLSVCRPKCRCSGLLGWIFGHRYYIKHYWGKEPRDFCQRCGASHD